MRLFVKLNTPPVRPILCGWAYPAPRPLGKPHHRSTKRLPLEALVIPVSKQQTREELTRYFLRKLSLASQSESIERHCPSLPRFKRIAVPDEKKLTAREVYQVLREAAAATRPTRRITKAAWDEIYCGLMTVDVDGWVITLYNDCSELDYCDSCYSPDGRKYDFSSRNALDPVELLSTDEHRQLEDLLRNI